MKSPSFNAYPNNWLASSRIAAMAPEQEGAYWRLLCYQWNSEDQTIPAADDDLAALSRLGERWPTLGAKVRACFDAVPDMPGRIRNERLWHEYCRIVDLREKQSSGGRAGMASRWSKPAIANAKDTNKTAITDLLDTNNRESGVGSRESGTVKRENTPLPPVGDAGVAPEDGQPRAKPRTPPAWTPTPDQLRVGGWFGRKATTKWSDKELRAWKALQPIPPEDIALMETRYTDTDPEVAQYRRRDIFTLLNNWHGELDRARQPKLGPAGFAPGQIHHETSPLVFDTPDTMHEDRR